MMNLDLLNQWLVKEYRKIYTQPISNTMREKKIQNLSFLKKAHEIFKEILVKPEFDELVIFWQFNKLEKEHFQFKLKKDTPALTYFSGTPNFQLFKITLDDRYVVYNPMLHLWKKQEIDPNIFDVYDSLPGSLYQQPLETDTPNIELPDSYDLFVTNASSRLIGFDNNPEEYGTTRVIDKSKISAKNFHEGEKSQFSDERTLLEAFRYAKENKRLTVFKEPHVIARRFIKLRDPNIKIGKDRTVDRGAEMHRGLPSYFDYYKEIGLTSEYCIFTNCDLNYLINGADRVYSSNSGATLNALLARKPVATFTYTDLSEIVPVISSADDLPNEPLDVEILMRFLSWYYHKLCINITDANASERIEERFRRYLKNPDLKEMLQ